MKLAVLAPLFLVAVSSPALADGLSDTLMRAGLGPDALAASGVAASEVAGVVTDVQDYIDGNSTALSDADSVYLAAQQSVESLKKLVRSGKATAQDVADLATAQSLLDAAGANREAALDDLFDAGVDGLTVAQNTALANVRANDHWGLPIEFLVKNRTDQGWLDLSEALTNERVSAEEGISASPACVTLLLSERSDSAVAAAKTAYDTNRSAVQTSWDSAVSGS